MRVEYTISLTQLNLNLNDNLIVMKISFILRIEQRNY